MSWRNRKNAGGLVIALFSVVGCRSLWSPQPPAAPPPHVSQVPQVSQSPIRQTAAHDSPTRARLNQVVQRLTAANPRIGFQPQFETDPTPVLRFARRGDARWMISDGLILSCRTDDQLAAIVAWQLAQATIDHASAFNDEATLRQRQLPPEVRIGPEGGTYGDLARRQAELAKLGYDQRSRKKPPADARSLARRYLTQAGYNPGALDEALALLAKAGPAEVAPAPESPKK